MAPLPSLSLDKGHLDAALLQLLHLWFGGASIRDHSMNATGRQYQRKTSASELAGIANRHDLPGDFHHHAIDLRLKKVRGAQSVTSIQTVYPQEQNVCIQPA